MTKLKKWSIAIGKWTAIGLALSIFTFFSMVYWPLNVAEAPNRPETILIQNASIVDVRAGNILKNTDVFVRGDNIEALGQHLNMRAERVIDAEEKFLIPGLFDMHGHSNKSAEEWVHPLFIAAGVTGVRDMGGCIGLEDAFAACIEDKKNWNQEVQNGERVAPRYDLVTSLAMNGGQELPDDIDPNWGGSTPIGAIERVAFDAGRGINFLKTYTGMSRESYFAAAKAVKDHNMHLAGHLPLEVTAMEAIEAGQRSFEHARVLIWHCFDGIDKEIASGSTDRLRGNDPELGMVKNHNEEKCQNIFKAMVENNVAYVPTHITRKLDAFALDEEFRTDPRLKYIPTPLRQGWLQDADGMARRASSGGQEAYMEFYKFGLVQTKRAHEAGVQVLIGTDAMDSFAFPGLGVADEFNHFRMAGISPVDTLRAATLEPAKFLELEGKAGEIIVGARADLVLLNSNPLESHKAIRNIHSVILAGNHFDRASLDELLEIAENNSSSLTQWPKFIWQILNSPIMLKQFAD